MPRVIPIAQQEYAMSLMRQGMGQREIERETGLSRPFIRKLAKKINHQFPRNGVEILGRICMCTNCGSIFRRPPSKAVRARNTFCDEDCKKGFMKGVNHPSWRHGKTAATFSSWIKNQAGYQDWRQKVLERDGHMCAISGRTDDLQVHHVLPKAENISPDKALDVNNGLTLNREVHERVHSLIREGYGFEEALEKLKQEYSKKEQE